MKTKFPIILALLACFWSLPILAQPVTPNASPEAKALLEYVRGLSGRHILSGQHNFPGSGERNTRFAADIIGKTPVVWSQDFGFAKAGDKDSYLARPAVIQEAIRQHKKGALITFCWHAVPPTADEPVTFQPLPGFDSMALASVQGRLQEKQFKDILTPGTKLYKQWIKQVDNIAGFLRQLQDAHVPVLWRPYHEMNGDWFWWGGRHAGKYTTAALYRQIFDRLVNFHKLNNLIWVWSVDRPSRPDREFSKYYPGNQFLDILALDVYGNDFNQDYYEGLLSLSQGKPITLAEVGNPPALEIISKQPNWTYWVVWAGMARNTTRADYEKLAMDSRVLFLEDPQFIAGVNTFRKACNMEPLSQDGAADFTGEWVLNEYESKLQGFGPPANKLSMIQKGNELTIKSTTVVEWGDDEISEQTLTLDGKEIRSIVFDDLPRVQHVNWSARRDTLKVDSRVTFNFGGKPSELTGLENWTLRRMKKKLIISQTLNSRMGVRNSLFVYDKK